MKNLLIAGTALLTLAAAPVMAQPSYNGVRVMVAADDADPKSVIRSSDMYHRLQLPLNDEMGRNGYRVLFEDAVTAELRYEVEDRSAKQKSIALAKSACTSGKATLCPRVLILVKTRATADYQSFGTVAKVRMTGEIIDISGNTSLAGWEAPSLEFPAPKNCTNVCIEDIIGDNARAVALSLADTLRRMLDRHINSTASARAVPGGGSTAQGLVNNYVISFEHFDMPEVLPLKAIIETFPETLEITMPQGAGGAFSINLVSKAKADNLIEWLHLMMEDRGYNLNNIKISTGPGKFTVDRIVEDGYRPTAAGRRFK